MRITTVVKTEKVRRTANNDPHDIHNLLDTSDEPWLILSRDYTYNELLSRVYSFMNVLNPDYATEKKVKMIVPIVQKDGSKKTRFVNVVDICNRYVDATNWIVNNANAKFLVCTVQQNM
jgi:hypothetical protein